MLYADYTFLNKPLAAFYGIEKDVARPARSSAWRARRVRPRRRAAARRGADDDVCAVADEPGQARRLGPAANSRHPDPAAAGRRRHHPRRRSDLQRPDAAAATDAAQAQRDLRELPPADRPARLPARRFRRGRPRRAQTYADGKPVDVTGEFADKTTIVGTDGLLSTCRRQDRSDDDALEEDDRLRAGTYGDGVRPAAHPRDDAGGRRRHLRRSGGCQRSPPPPRSAKVASPPAWIIRQISGRSDGMRRPSEA